MPTLAQSGPGKVTALWGTALIRGANGKMRALKIGDLVRPGDVILTAQDGIVQINPVEATRAIAAGTPETSDIDRVIAGLDQGDTEVAPAAGVNGGGDGSLDEALRVGRISETLSAGVLPAAANDADVVRPAAATSTMAPERFAASTTPGGPPVSPAPTTPPLATPPPPPAPPAPLSADSSAISAAEEGVATPLGLAAPTGSVGSATITVNQVPAIGEVRKADGTLVTAGTTLTAAELTGLIYVPPADYDGSAPVGSFGYTAQSNGQSATGGTSITLAAVNDAPLATPATSSGIEDGTLPVSLTGTDADGFITGVTVASIPAGSTLLLDDGVTPVVAGQTLTPAQAAGLLFRPAPDFNGSADIAFTVTDNGGRVSAPATVGLVVTAVNDAPVAANDAFATIEDTPLTLDVLGNDSDTDGDALTVIAVAGQPIAVGSPVTLPQGSIALNPDGTLRFTPNPDFNGTVSFGYTVSDGATSATGAVSVNVAPTADAAVIGGQASGATVEDDTLSTSGTLTISDPDAGEASFVAQPATAGSYGSFTLAADGSWSYALNNALPAVQALAAGQTLSETFSVAAADGTRASVVVTIAGTDDAPVISSNTGSVTETTQPSASGTLTATDVDNPALAFVAGSTGGAYGTLTLAADGAWTYTLDARAESLAQGQTVNDVITVALNDGSTTTVRLNVTGTNDAPLATNDLASTAINTPLASIAVLANDSDVDGDALSVVSAALANPALGNVSINPDGTLAFSPALNVTGAVLVNYTVRDPSGATSSATLTVNVGTNSAPTGADAVFTLAEDGSRSFSAVDFGFADTDAGQTLAAVRIDSLPAAGSLSFNGTAVTAGQLITAANLASLVFTPAPNANGNAYAAFGFSVQDSAGAFDATPNTITLNVSSAADAAVIGGDTGGTTVEDTTLVASGTLTIADPDAGEAAFVAQASVAGAHGTFSIDAAGQWVYTLNNGDPAVQALGAGQSLPTESFSVASIDGTSQVITVTITGSNDAAVITAGVGSVTEDTTLTTAGVLAVSDVDAGQAGFIAQPSTAGSYGSFTLAADGSWSYALDNALPVVQALGAGQTLTETFAVASIDGSLSSVTVTVNGTNDAAVIGGSAVGSVTEDGILATGGTLTVSDVDGAPTFVAQPATPGSYGSFTLATDGTWNYALNNALPAVQALGAGQTLSETFSVACADGTSSSVVVTINGTDDAPVISTGTGTVVENTQPSASGTLSATDVDNPALAFVPGTLGGAYGSLVLAGNGAWTYTLDTRAEALAQGQTVTDTITVTLNDGSTTTVRLGVSGTNDAPVANAATASGNEDPAARIAVTFAANDVDGSIASYTVASLPTNGSLYAAASGGSPLAAGAVVTGPVYFQPTANWNGTTSFQYRATDNNGATSNTTSATITVAPVNDAPTLTGLAANVTYTEAATTSVTRTQIDSAIVFADIDSPNLAGGSLTVRIVNAVAGEDLLDVRSQGSAAGQISVVGSDVLYNFGAGAVAIGSVSGGTAGAPLVVSFNANATPAAVDALIQQVRYGNQSQRPDTTARSITFTVVDGDGTTNGGADTVSQTVTVSIVSSNDAPSFSGLGGTRAFTEGGAPVLLDNNASINDPELGTGFIGSLNNWGGASLQLARSTGASADDRFAGSGTLSLAGGNVVLAGATVGSYDTTALAAGRLLITFASGTTGAQANSVLRQISYANASDAPPASLTIGYVVSDGNTGAQGTPASPRTASGSVSVNITGVNDAPVAQPGSGSTSENAVLNASVPPASDADGSIAGYTLLSGPGAGNGTLVFNTDGSYRFDPGAHFDSLAVGASRPVTFTYRATDNSGATSAPATVAITVTGTNDGPVAAAGAFSVAEGAAVVSGNVGATDVDAGAVIGYTLNVSAPAGLSFNPDGSYSFDATASAYDVLNAGQSIVLTLPYTATDEHGATSIANLVITVTGTNDAPSVQAVVFSVAEDAAVVSGTVGANDPDSGAVLTFALTGPAPAGLVLNSDGSYSFDPADPAYQSLAAGDARVLNVPYSVTDEHGASSSAGFVVVVIGTNDTPMALADSATVAEDGSVVIDVRTNDSDAEGTSLTITQIAGLPIVVGGTVAVGAGDVTLNADGTLTFAPNANYNGSLDFGYTVGDGIATASAQVHVDVTAVNDAPVATHDAASTAINTPLASIAVLANDSDVDGDALSVVSAALANPALGNVSINPDGTLAFNPALNVTGAVLVNYTVLDPSGATSSATLTVNVGTNSAPTGEDAVFTLAEDGSRSFSAVDFGFADTDAGQTLAAVRIDSLPAAGSLSFNGTAVTAGQLITAANLASLVFTPAPNANGNAYAAFGFSVQDSAGAFDATPNTITLNVSSAADAAVIGGDTGGTTVEDTTVTASGTLTIADPDAGEAAFVAQANVAGAHGTFSIDAAGQWVYTLNNGDPAVQALGAGQSLPTESFSVASIDGTSQVITVTITGTNDGPVAQAASFSVAEDAAVVNGSVTASDVDTGAVLSYALTGAAPAGLTFNGNGSYSFDPSNAAYQSLGVGQSTVLTVPYRATDAQGASSVANLVITVTGMNDGPVAVADTGAVNENATLTATAAAGVLANDADVDTSDTTAVSAVSFGAASGTVGAALAGTYGTLTLNADGGYSYSADLPAAEALAAGQIVTENFSYTTRDAAGVASTATLTFTVTGTGDVPTITGPLTGSATEDATLTASGTLAVADPDAGQSSFVAQSGSAGTYGSFSINAAGAWTYALNNAAANVQSLPIGASVTDSFTVTTTDGTTRSVVITVNGTNDGPVAVGSSFSVAEDAAVVSGAVTATDVDTGAALSYALTGAAPAGLTFNSDGSYGFNAAHPAYQSLGVGQSTVLTVPFRATDAQGASSVANMVITVTGTNDGPVAVADSGSVAENATLTTSAVTGVLANDADVDAGDTKVVSAVAFGATGGTVGSALNGSYGSLTLNADGSYSYSASQPAAEALAAGQIVTESFSYTMRDAAGSTSSATLTFTITGTNDVPTITGPLAGAVAEDTTLTSSGTLVVSDPDAGQSSFVAQSGTPGTYGSFAITAAGVWIYTLANAAANVQSLPAGASASDSFTVTTTDGTTRTIVVTINGTNDGPVAVGSSFSVAEDASVVNGAVSATDVDAGAVLGYALTGAAPAGLTFNADGSYSFDASNAAYQSLGVGQSQVITVPFRATDAQGASSVANLVITVTGTNDAPTAVADTGSLSENATLTTTAAGGVLANDTEVDTGDTKAVSAFSFGATSGVVGSGLNGTYGTLTLNADGSYGYAANRPAADTLAAGQIVTESFSYTMRDAAGATSTATITFTITGTGDAPTITGPLTGSVVEDTTLSSSGALVVSDPDAGQSSFAAQTGTPGGYGNFSITTAGVWTYTLANAAANVQSLAAGVSVTDSFTVTTADGTTRSVVITINGTNDGPVAVGSSFTVAEDAAVVNGAVTATDVDAGAVLGYALIGAAPAGLAFNANGTYSFNPANAAYQSLGVGQSQVITVPFRATDAQGASSVANLVITVTGTNDGPVAVADTGALAENATLTVSAATGVLANDTDVDGGDTKAVSAVSFGATGGTVGAALNGTYGTLTLNADGSYSYAASRPAAEALTAGQIVTESFGYTMRDAAGATSTATITFTVTGTGDVPTITGPLTGSVTEDTTLSSTGTLLVSDPDAGQSSFVAQAGAAGTYGSFSINAAGAWTYALNNAAANVQSLPIGASVTDSFTVTTADGTTRTVAITINGTNDGPVAVGSSFTVAEDAAVVNGAVTATDVDTGAVLGYALTGAAPAGLIFNANGTYSFNPANAAYQSLGVGQSQVITVPFRATDAQGASSVANLVITVTGTNDGPTAVADTGALDENATLSATAVTGVLANDTDADTGDTKAVSAVSFGATSGSVGSALNGSYGTLTLNADGSYAYSANRPAAEALTAGQIVTENFSYTTRDTAGATSTATLTFTITGTNDVPTITGPLAGSVTEDTTLTSTGTLVVTDADAGQSSFVAQAGAAGTYGSFSINAAGAWTYTLNNAAANVQSLAAGTSVTDSFTVTTADGTTRSVVITVNGTNDGPVAIGSSFSVAEDAAIVSGSVTATDVDTGAALSYALTGAAPAGLTFNASGGYSFNPAHAAYQSLGAGQSTVVTVPFRATDAQGASSVANLVITITGTNDGPVAVADTGSVNENATLSATAAAGVLANDTDVDTSDTKAVSAISFGATSGAVGAALGGNYGTLTLNSNGSYSYAANRPAAEALTAGQIVTESFSYTMRDAAGATSTATITFTVTGTGDAPTITGPLTGSVTEDTTLSSTGTLVVSDPDAGQSSFVAQSGVAGTYGSFAITTAGAWTYALNNAAANVQSLPVGASVTDSFTVTTADGTTRTVVITVNGTNDGPVAVGSSFTVAEDAAVVNGSVTATDVDAGAVLGYALTGAAPAGLSFNANGTYSFNPANAAYQSLGVGQSTVITVPFRTTDAQGASSVANLVITVTGTNDGPVAAANTGALNENATLAVAAATGVLANDTDIDSGDSKTVSAVAFGATAGSVGAALNGGYGTLTLNADGSYSYAANRPAADALTAGQVVTESFSYTMRDAAGATSSATITFTITGTNDAPTITGPLTGTVREDTTLTSTGTLVVSDTDAGQSSFVAQSGSVGTYGSFSINAAGAWTYTLNNAAANVQSLGATASVTDSFTVTTADGTTRTVIVTVNGTNDGPVATADSVASINEDTAVTISAATLLANDSDRDSGDVLTIQSVQGASGGSVALNGAGNVVFTPNANYSGPASFTYTVSDGRGGSSTATVSLAVNAVADTPTITATAPSNILFGNDFQDGTATGWIARTTTGATAAIEINPETSYGGSNSSNRVLEVEANTGVNSLYRELNTVPGDTYTFTFDYSARSGYATGTDSQLTLYVDGVAVRTMNASSFGFTPQSISFVGNATGTTTLEFRSTDSNSLGGLVDNLVLTRTGSPIATTHGTEDTPIALPSLAAVFGDSADNSETHTLTLSGVPAGATLSDGSHWFTATAGSTSVVVFNEDNPAAASGGSNWDLTRLTVIAPVDFSGTINLSATATATEASNGSTASTVLALPVEVVSVSDGALTGSNSGNTLTGTSGQDLINGRGGNDTLSGGAGADILIGGTGDDTLSGGSGADVFRWQLNDDGSGGSPARDTITDFDSAGRAQGGDVLDLRDLLGGENQVGGTGNLVNYLDFDTTSTPGSTIIRVSSSGGFAGGSYASGQEDERITLAGVDLRTTLGVGSAATDAQIIQELLNRGKLITDGS